MLLAHIQTLRKQIPARKDRSPEPILAAYKNLVFKEWWTNATGTTNADGRFTTRAFLGDDCLRIEASGHLPANRCPTLAEGGTRIEVVLPPSPAIPLTPPAPYPQKLPLRLMEWVFDEFRFPAETQRRRGWQACILNQQFVHHHGQEEMDDLWIWKIWGNGGIPKLPSSTIRYRWTRNRKRNF